MPLKTYIVDYFNKVDFEKVDHFENVYYFEKVNYLNEVESLRLKKPTINLTGWNTHHIHTTHGDV